MSIRSHSKLSKPEINLSGPDGNAFVLLAHAKRLARELHIESMPILDEMMSGDYENLITVFDNHFGDYVDLIRE